MLLRALDYKNHRIFTLRCLHKDLIPVSIKLKSTLKTEKARKIIRKAEKDLLQARVKAINSILDNVTKQTEECRSQLASIISAQRLRECQGFVDKVGEIRFTKVKQRQLNKYNILLNKKEGNITRANATTPNNSNNSTNSNNLASQAGRQVSTSLPPGEGSNLSQAGRQALSFPLGKEATYPWQVFPRQLLTFPLGKEAVLPRPLLTFLPGKEAVSPRQLLTFPQVKEAILPRQLLTFLPAKEAIHPQQAVRQALSFPLGKEAVLPRQLLTFPPVKEAILPQQLLTFLLGKEAIHPQQAVRQALSFPLGKEAVLPWQLLTFPWVKEAVLPRPLLTVLPGKEAVPPRQWLTFLPRKEAVLPRPLLTFPWGKVTVLPRQVNLTIKLGQSGKALGILPGIGYPRLPRRIVLSPRKTTPPLPPSRLPQGSSNEEPNPKWVINLSNKPLTPAQRSVLAKGPNFVVTPRPPPNLEYITAIEAVCTKLSQQDAEELRADINRVLRSSHPPNLT